MTLPNQSNGTSPSPWRFSGGDFVSLPSLTAKLKAKADPTTIDLWSRFSVLTQELLLNYQEGKSDPQVLQAALVEELNRIICAGRFSDVKSFPGRALSSEAKLLHSQNPTGDALVHLNRLLIAEAYPLDISRNPSPERYRHVFRFSAMSLSSLLLFILSISFILFRLYEKRACSPFRVDDIHDASPLVSRIAADPYPASQPVSRLLWEKYLDTTTKALSTNFNSRSQSLKQALANDLNKFVFKSSLPNTQYFTNVALSSEARTLLDSKPINNELWRLNRMLLEDTYPLALERRERLYWPHLDRDTLASFDSSEGMVFPLITCFVFLLNILRLSLSFWKIEEGEGIAEVLSPAFGGFGVRLLSRMEFATRLASIAVLYIIINLLTGTDLICVISLPANLCMHPEMLTARSVSGELCSLCMVLFGLFFLWDFWAFLLYRMARQSMIADTYNKVLVLGDVANLIFAGLYYMCNHFSDSDKYASWITIGWVTISFGFLMAEWYSSRVAFRQWLGTRHVAPQSQK